MSEGHTLECDRCEKGLGDKPGEDLPHRAFGINLCCGCYDSFIDWLEGHEA